VASLHASFPSLPQSKEDRFYKKRRKKSVKASTQFCRAWSFIRLECYPSASINSFVQLHEHDKLADQLGTVAGLTHQVIRARTSRHVVELNTLGGGAVALVGAARRRLTNLLPLAADAVLIPCSRSRSPLDFIRGLL